MKIRIDVLRQLISETVVAEIPLTPEEEKMLAKANVYVMDYEADGGMIPANIDSWMHADHVLKPSEARHIIDWVSSLAPGTYWL